MKFYFNNSTATRTFGVNDPRIKVPGSRRASK